MSGVVIENMDILQQIKSISKNKEVYYIVGNHDYHLKKLKWDNYEYPFEFQEGEINEIGTPHIAPLRLPDRESGKTYLFTHGYEFEPIMWIARESFNLLCYSGDEVGGKFSKEYGTFENLWMYLRHIKTLGRYKNILNPADKRLKGLREALKEIHEKDWKPFKSYSEKIASEEKLKKDQVLVFGHIHVPFVNLEKTVINLGSWLFEENELSNSDHNTYLEIKNGDFKLRKYPSGEIKPRKI